MTLIRNWIAGRLDQAATTMERRLDQAMACPECGHGAETDPVIRAEQAEACDCTDELCACYVESDRVPCGRADAACGLRGGSAHCGGCRD